MPLTADQIRLIRDALSDARAYRGLCHGSAHRSKVEAYSRLDNVLNASSKAVDNTNLCAGTSDVEAADKQRIATRNDDCQKRFVLDSLGKEASQQLTPEKIEEAVSHTVEIFERNSF